MRLYQDLDTDNECFSKTSDMLGLQGNWMGLFGRMGIFSFLLVQRCIADNPPVNYFGFCNIFFDKWKEIKDKANHQTLCGLPLGKEASNAQPPLCKDADRLIGDCCAILS